MKKIFVLLLTLAMVLSLAACGGGSEADSTAPDDGGDGGEATGTVYYLNFKPPPCSRSTALWVLPTGGTTAMI